MRTCYEKAAALPPPLKGQLIRCLHAAIVAGACLGSTAQATTPDEATRLLKAGKHAEAMKIIDDGLKRNPKDPHLRFVKGVALAERKKPREAIAVFQKLSEDHPELPEPHNNLAVLYSQDGQIEKARAALNMAIKANPSVATVYENLGDVHARIAAQSYNKALNISSNNAGSQPKLKMVSALVLPTAVPAVVLPVSEAPAPAAPQVAAAATIAQVTVPKTPPPVAPSKKVDSSRSAIAVPQPGKVAIAPASIPAPAPAPIAASHQDEVNEAINAWKKAWETKDMNRYVAAYDNGFHSGGARNHAQWVRLRRARILNKDSITITIEKPAVRLDGNTAVASFRQVYTGGNVHSDGTKTLTFQKKSGKWKITEEVSTD